MVQAAAAQAGWEGIPQSGQAWQARHDGDALLWWVWW